MRRRALPILLLMMACSGQGMKGNTPGFSVEPTVYFKVVDGDLVQKARMTITYPGTEDAIEAEARVRIGDTQRTQDLGTLTRNVPASLDLYVPDIPEGTEQGLSVFVSKKGEDRPFAALAKPWKAQRKWTLFLIPYCHLDVGFSNTQADVLKIQKLNVDGQVTEDGSKVGALDLLQQSDAFPDDSRFRFTCEVSWPCVEFLKDPGVPKERKDLFLKYAGQGRIEVGGFYISHLNKFMSEEALVRSTYFSGEWLRRTYGIKPKAAVIDDAGDASSVVQPLSRAGIRYFHFGPNTIKFGLPPLFYLQSPSNSESRVLMWLTPNLGAYGENTDLGLRPPIPPTPTEAHDPNAPLPDYEGKVIDHLTWLQDRGLPLKGPAAVYDYRGFRADYPYDAYLVMYYPAHAGDNGHQDLTPSLIAYDWNSRYAYPRFRIATLSEFFEYMEEKYGAGIPTFTGDFSGFWGEQIFFSDVQMDPKKEFRARAFEDTMSAAEKFSSFLLGLDPSYPYPRDDVMSAWSGIILNNDHNPIPVPISGNLCPSTSSGICYTTTDVAAWKEARLAWETGATVTAQTLLRKGLDGLASAIGYPSPNPGIAVFNPVSWTRSDVVTAASVMTGVSSFIIRDPDTGGSVPYQVLSGGSLSGYTIAFIAKGVPSLGYKTFTMEPAASPPAFPSDLSSGLRDGNPYIENSYYRVVVGSPVSGSKQGGIIGLWDKELGRELVNPGAAYGVNQFVVLSRSEDIGNGTILNTSGNLLNAPGFTSVTAAVMETGPVFARVRVTGEYNAGIRTPDKILSVTSFLSGFLGMSITIPTSSPLTLTQDILLYRGMKRVEFIQNFGDGVNPVPLQVLDNAFAYSFAVPNMAQFTIEYPYNPIRFGTADPYHLYSPLIPGDEFPVAPLGLKAANLFNMTFLWMNGIPPENMFRHYVDVSGGDFGITFASRDSGIILPMGYEVSPFPKERKGLFYHLCLGPTLLGNIVLGAPQDSSYTFTSALTSHGSGRDFDHAYGGWNTAAQFGWGYDNPLQSRVIPAGNTPSLIPALPDAISFLSIDSDNVIVSTAKPAEDGNGVILRLYETQGRQTTATIRPRIGSGGYVPLLASSVEKDTCILSSGADGSFTVDISAGALTSVRLASATPAGLSNCPQATTAGCSCRAGGQGTSFISFVPLAVLLMILRNKRIVHLITRRMPR